MVDRGKSVQEGLDSMNVLFIKELNVLFTIPCKAIDCLEESDEDLQVEL